MLIIIGAAKTNILGGFNKHYIPGWDDSCTHLIRVQQQATTKKDIDTTATALLHKLDELGSGVCKLHTFKSQGVVDHKHADKHDAL